MQSLAYGKHYVNVSHYTHLDVFNTICGVCVLSLLLPGWLNQNYNFFLNYNFFKGMFPVLSWKERGEKDPLWKPFLPLLPSELAISIHEKWKRRAPYSKITKNSTMATAWSQEWNPSWVRTTCPGGRPCSASSPGPEGQTQRVLWLDSIAYLFFRIFVSSPTLSRKRFKVILLLWKESEIETAFQKTSFLFPCRFSLCH